MKACTQCNTEKPESEYYRRANGRLYAHCKTCHKKKTAVHSRIRKNKTHTFKPSETTEQIVLRKLARVGVPTIHIPGWCDLLAFGLVQIEVKHVYFRFPGHVFQFTYRQKQDGLHADILALLWQNAVYFLPVDHPNLYNDDGLLKTGVSINVSGHYRTGSPLTTGDLWSMSEGILEIRKIMKTKIAMLQQGVGIDTLLARVPVEYMAAKAS